MLKAILTLALLAVLPSLSVLADISYTSNGQVYTEGFNTFGTAGAAWADDSTIAGWFSNRTTFLAGNGSGNTGGLYSFGATGNSERAIGSLGSNSANPVLFGVRLTNLTNNTMTKFTVSYSGEQWRDANNADQTLSFGYVSGSGVNLASGGFTSVTGLDFASPTSSNSGALNGNASPTTISFVVSNITWLPGQQLVLRWADVDDSPGSDHGLAVDNFSFVAVPEPSSMMVVSLVGLALAGRFRRRR